MAQYYFDELDPVSFQRLVNAILTARYGDLLRITPIRGSDGGRDAEILAEHPMIGSLLTNDATKINANSGQEGSGMCLFQVKHHRLGERRIADVRQAVVTDFEDELKRNVLPRSGDQHVDYFYLITNVPCSADALKKLDALRAKLLRGQNIHADVWWQETLVAHLDLLPHVWLQFPNLFAGGVVPFVAKLGALNQTGLPRSVRLAISQQYDRDRRVKFRQIELEQDLFKIFVDLDIDMRLLSEETRQSLVSMFRNGLRAPVTIDVGEEIARSLSTSDSYYRGRRFAPTVLELLVAESEAWPIRKLILEGGPGQGKSTVTQMTVQLYRKLLLQRGDEALDDRLPKPRRVRIPFRMELRAIAEYFSANSASTIEAYLALTLEKDSGGCKITVDDLHSLVESSPTLFIFDGLDEIGNEDMRSTALREIAACITRLEELRADFRVLLTTRPPALVGRRDILVGFQRIPIAPLERERVYEYLDNWLQVQVPELDETERIKTAFNRRLEEPHVQALVRNPMQLSVLLQLIRLKGEAFPDRRAELYREYFNIVIDRDVEKSPELITDVTQRPESGRQVEAAAIDEKLAAKQRDKASLSTDNGFSWFGPLTTQS